MTAALVITMGEPSGVGPELCLHALNAAVDMPMVVVGDYRCLSQRAKMLALPFSAAHVDSIDDIESSAGDAGDDYRAVLDIPLATNADIGKPSADNAAAVLRQLQVAADGCMDGSFSAMITAPVQKSSILAAGHYFVGQTEFIGECINKNKNYRGKKTKPVMMLAGRRLRVALATTHLPLAEVAAAINADKLFDVLQTLNDGLKQWCGIDKPRIGVMGLNPHCGEGGLLGDEENRAIIPALHRAKENGINATGPIAADAVFLTEGYDCVLAMYHDQGLPVVKYDDADGTVNITLGLPFLRASPAHGTALDIAGTGKARTAGMLAALTVGKNAAAKKQGDIV